MAPLSKKAKTAAKPTPGSGLGKFFGSKSSDLAAASGDTAKIGAAPCAPAPTTASTTQAVQPPSGGGLTEDQKKKIEENRRMALARKEAKANGQELPKEVPKPTLPTPAAAEVPKPTLPTPAAVGGLTEAQKQRIEENRRMALARKEVPKPTPPPAPAVRNAAHDFDNADCGGAEFDYDDMNMDDGPDCGHADFDNADIDMNVGQKSPAPKQSFSDPKQGLKRSSDITPEKPPLPKETRRVVLPNPPASPAVPKCPPARPAQKALDETGVGVGEAKFTTFGKVSWKQYDSLYSVRFGKLRASVLAQAKSLWSNEVPAENFLSNIVTSSPSTSSDLVFVGVTFKSMPSRDNVIKQYRDVNVATSTLPEDDVDKQPNLCSDADVLWLEDSVFRIQLELPADQVAKFATGFVVAVRGSLTSEGKFTTKEFCLAQGLTSTPLPACVPTKGASPGPYLALLSGLSIGAPDENVNARNQAVDFLLARNQKGNALKLAKAVQHVIVCGGVYHVDKLGTVPAGLQEADSMFSQLAEKLPVVVLPGHKDPTNLSLPQMPLHPFFFSKAKNCSQFKPVTNPYQCKLGDLEILGHAGQPIRDLMRCTSITSPMEALTTCLDASLIAPTAPDTLATQPFKDNDPFIIEKVPQVFFSGGHSKAEYEWRVPAAGKPGTLCVCVPAFHERPSIVLVNLSNPSDVVVQDFGA